MSQHPHAVDPGRLPLIRASSARPLEIEARSFVFVRHGETDGNRQRIYQYAEQPLNENGLAQARRASEALVGHPVRRIFGSTMARAWRTAEIVAEPHGLEVTPSDLIRERWFGSLVGTPITEIDWGYDPPGGETLIGFVERTRRGFQQLLVDAEGSVVVAHGGNLAVLVHGLGIEFVPEFGANASPLLFERSTRGWQMTPIVPPNALIGAMS